MYANTAPVLEFGHIAERKIGLTRLLLAASCKRVTDFRSIRFGQSCSRQLDAKCIRNQLQIFRAVPLVGAANFAQYAALRIDQDS